MVWEQKAPVIVMLTKEVEGNRVRKNILFILSDSRNCTIGRGGHNEGFHPQTKNWNHFVQHNGQHHGKVLLSGYHLNGYT